MLVLKHLGAFLLPILVSLALHWRVFSYDLIGYHVWRQTQTQTVVYHFTFTDNNIFHPQKFDLNNGKTLAYEFPLFQWLVAQADRIFGYSVAWSRIGAFLSFILFLGGFYTVVRQFFSQKTALIANWLAAFSPLLYYYCVNPLPDVLALALGTWAVAFFFRYVNHTSGSLVPFFILLMAAALVKLPYILFGAGMPLLTWRWIRSERINVAIKQSALAIVFLLPVLAWYAYAVPTWAENPIAQGITANNKSFGTLAGYLWFTIVSSVPELLTNYAAVPLLLAGIWFFVRAGIYRKRHAKYFSWIFAAFAAYYLFEINLIERTHDYYLLPFVPLIFMVCAAAVSWLFETRYRNWVYVICALVPLTAWLRMDHRWDLENPGFNQDLLQRRADIQNVLPANAICIVHGDPSRFIALYYLKRHGYSLLSEEPQPEELQAAYSKGARYMVFVNGPYLKSLSGFDTACMFRHELSVYRLKAKGVQ